MSIFKGKQDSHEATDAEAVEATLDAKEADVAEESVEAEVHETSDIATTPEETAFVLEESEDQDEAEPASTEAESFAAEEEEAGATIFDDEKVVEESAEHRLTVANPMTESSLSFDEKVIEKIALLVIDSIDGVALGSSSSGFFSLKPSNGIVIHVDDNDDVSIDLNIVIEYGRSAPQIFEELKEELSKQITAMTGLNLKKVNVHVANILSAEEFNQQ
ncbi:MAG: Asp23/Gls24 family envelope stress response protein [Eubacteriales bacterium]|nr:Asp23/Gls24 family envelope stress response protein [Eubacteriales bacterium]